MKQYIVIGFMLPMMLFTSCDTSLEEVPHTFVSEDAFFTSEESFDLVIISLYSHFGGWAGFYGTHGFELRECFSEYMGTPLDGEVIQISNNVPSETLWGVRMNWANSYEMISNANLILSKIPEVELSNEAATRIEAETKMLRAFAYFQLVRFFGDVPLKTTTVSSIDETLSDRASQSEVYELIVSDLLFAEANLPSVYPEEGRAYSWAASALLARVYLTMAGNPLNLTENFAKARDKALEVINNGPFELMVDYAEAFHNHTYTKESIWSVTQLPTGEASNYLMWWSVGNPGNEYGPINPNFIASFTPGDRRREWGVKDEIVNSQTGEVYLNFPHFNKFVDQEIVDQGITGQGTRVSGFQVPIVRLAEMYLVAAEAENEISGPANALQHINVIRNRAGIPDLDSSISQNDFRYAVFQERRWELHFEGQGWFDLKRTNNFHLVDDARTLTIPTGTWNNTFPLPDWETISNNIPQNPPYGGS